MHTQPPADVVHTQPQPRDERTWLTPGVRGVVGVLAQEEKLALSELLYAGLRGAELGPLRAFLGEVQERVR